MVPGRLPTGMSQVNDLERCYLIRGETCSGKAFRPSDWAERLAGVITVFVGEKTGAIQPISTRFAMPVVRGDTKCLLVIDQLGETCPAALDFVLRFAQDNELVVDRMSVDAL